MVPRPRHQPGRPVAGLPDPSASWKGAHGIPDALEVPDDSRPAPRVLGLIPNRRNASRAQVAEVVEWRMSADLPDVGWAREADCLASAAV